MVNIAVIGAGRLGTKIAGEMAYHRHNVMIFDPIKQCLDSAPSRIESDKEELRKDRILKTKDYQGSIVCAKSLKRAVEDADFIFESVVEDLEVKVSLMEKITDTCKPEAVIGTSSLNLQIDDIFSKAEGKDRCMGLRFLFPVFTIPEVEITSCQHTTQDNVKKVRLFLEDMNKILFIRSGSQPLILTDQQRQDRKKAFLERLKNSSDIECFYEEEKTDHVNKGIAGHCGIMKDLEQTNKDNCTVCRDRIRNSVIFPCHHIVTCYQCAKMLMNKKKPCPVCRKDITDIIQVHHS